MSGVDRARVMGHVSGRLLNRRNSVVIIYVYLVFFELSVSLFSHPQSEPARIIGFLLWRTPNLHPSESSSRHQGLLYPSTKKKSI